MGLPVLGVCYGYQVRPRIKAHTANVTPKSCACHDGARAQNACEQSAKLHAAPQESHGAHTRQLMNYCEGGKVEKASKREDLQEMLKIDNTGSLLYKGLEEDETALLTHGDAVTKIGMPHTRM